MNRLALAQRAHILGLLVEGNSINATCRITGAAKATVLRLLADVGTACTEYQNKVLVKLPCKRVQCDEIWSFVGAKQKNVAQGAAGYGDVWTWTAICADTKLVASWMVGNRDGQAAAAFMADLAPRMANRVQLTTDGHKAYLQAVEDAFGADVDYAMLVKLYGEPKGRENERRYSPGECCGTIKGTVQGCPNPRHVSTSYVERQNLTMRMSMRRFTRLTNGFSKKIENHAHAIALHFMFYNFGRIHKTLRVTPAMQARIADHVWSLEEIAALVPEPKATPRGPYRKRLSAPA